MKRWPRTIGELRRQIADLPDSAKIRLQMYNNPPDNLSIQMERTDVVARFSRRLGETSEFYVYMSILDSEDR